MRTDEEIVSRSPVKITVHGRNISIAPLPLSMWRGYIKSLAMILLINSEIFKDCEIDNPEVWLKVVSLKKTEKMIFRIFRRFLHLKNKFIKQLSIDEIVQLFLFVYDFNINAVKKKIISALQKLGIASQRFRSGGTLKPRWGKQGTR